MCAIKREHVYGLAVTALFTALFSVSAMIYIPLAVPVTLQTLVLFSSLLSVGGRRTSAAVFVYLALGAIGLPVFSGFSGGVGRLLEPSGGFLVGMLIAALAYWLFDRRGKGLTARCLLCLISLLILYSFGTLFYYFLYLGGKGSLLAVLLVTVLPFVLPDLLKLFAAAVIARRIVPFVKSKGIYR